MIQSINKDKNQTEKLGKKTLKFIYKKISGIFPYILFAFILGACLIFKSSLGTIKILTLNNFIAEILQLGILGFSYSINSATWYISSMLVVLFCLYPLAIKFKDNYNSLIAPLLLLLFIGICYSFDINIDDPLSKAGLGLNGLYKGFIFILLGNISHSITDMLKKVNFTKTGKVLLSIIELFLLVLLIGTMHLNVLGTIVVALITMGLVIITFSGKSYSKDMCNFPVLKKLGTFGFLMYLNNIYFRGALLNGNFNFNYKKYIVIYLGLTVAVSLLVYYLVPLLVKLLNKCWELCKKILIIQ